MARETVPCPLCEKGVPRAIHGGRWFHEVHVPGGLVICSAPPPDLDKAAQEHVEGTWPDDE